VTTVAVLTSRGAGRKLFIVDRFIAPDVAILDPRFTVSLPRELTIYTAMDALTHAIEAMTSILANEICDAQALHAIRLIRENLPVAASDGANEKARLNMQIAATLAGWAFTVAQTALVHGMAHTVGNLYHVHHGAACGVLLPKVMRYNAGHTPDKLRLVAQALGVDISRMSVQEAAMAAADEVEALMREVGHPLRLRDLGVPEADLPACAVHALADTANLFNARPVNDPFEILNLYTQAY
jgi:alcohol dehydrogenase class IV